MIAFMDAWGPFAPGLEAGERLARLRALRALVRVLTGPRGAALEAALRRAETGEGLEAALAALSALAAVDRRWVVASYAGLTCSKGGA